jgi:hypothetical protein
VQLRDAGQKQRERYALSPSSTTARALRGGSSRFSISFGTTCQNRSRSGAQSVVETPGEAGVCLGDMRGDEILQLRLPEVGIDTLSDDRVRADLARELAWS